MEQRLDQCVAFAVSGHQLRATYGSSRPVIVGQQAVDCPGRQPCHQCQHSHQCQLRIIFSNDFNYFNRITSLIIKHLSQVLLHFTFNWHFDHIILYDNSIGFDTYFIFPTFIIPNQKAINRWQHWQQNQINKIISNRFAIKHSFGTNWKNHTISRLITPGELRIALSSLLINSIQTFGQVLHWCQLIEWKSIRSDIILNKFLDHFLTANDIIRRADLFLQKYKGFPLIYSKIS